MYVKVKVFAGAKKESFEQKSDDHFEVAVKEKAERNMANKRVIELMSEYFKVPAGKVRIISGHHSPSKILSIDPVRDTNSLLLYTLKVIKPNNRIFIKK